MITLEQRKNTGSLNVMLDGVEIGHVGYMGRGRNGGWVGYSIHERYHAGRDKMVSVMGPYLMGKMRPDYTLEPRKKRATRDEAVAFVVDTHTVWLLLESLA